MNAAREAANSMTLAREPAIATAHRDLAIRDAVFEVVIAHERVTSLEDDVARYRTVLVESLHYARLLQLQRDRALDERDRARDQLDVLVVGAPRCERQARLGPSQWSELSVLEAEFRPRGASASKAA